MGDHELSTTDPEQEQRPQPVLDYAKVAAGVTGVILGVGTATTALGYTTDGQVAEVARGAGLVVEGLGLVAAVVLPLWAAVRARALVTPLASPRSVHGEPLMAVSAARTRTVAAQYAEPIPTGDPAPTPWAEDSTLRDANARVRVRTTAEGGRV